MKNEWNLKIDLLNKFKKYNFEELIDFEQNVD